MPMIPWDTHHSISDNRPKDDDPFVPMQQRKCQCKECHCESIGTEMNMKGQLLCTLCAIGLHNREKYDRIPPALGA